MRTRADERESSHPSPECLKRRRKLSDGPGGSGDGDELRIPANERESSHPSRECLKRRELSDDPVKEGSPTFHELQELSRKISDKWKKLGRQLDFEECDLIAIEQDNAGQLVEKAYTMLRQWKEWKGQDATHKALYEALCDGNVQRRDLAQKFCCPSSSPFAC